MIMCVGILPWVSWLRPLRPPMRPPTRESIQQWTKRKLTYLGSWCEVSNSWQQTSTGQGTWHQVSCFLVLQVFLLFPDGFWDGCLLFSRWLRVGWAGSTDQFSGFISPDVASFLCKASSQSDPNNHGLGRETSYCTICRWQHEVI